MAGSGAHFYQPNDPPKDEWLSLTAFLNEVHVIIELTFKRVWGEFIFQYRWKH